jgi:hypothetical protein
MPARGTAAGKTLGTIMNDSASTQSRSSGLTVGSLVVPILTGVIGFAAGYMADSFTRAAASSGGDANGTVVTTGERDAGRDGYNESEQEAMDAIEDGTDASEPTTDAEPATDDNDAPANG